MRHCPALARFNEAPAAPEVTSIPSFHLGRGTIARYATGSLGTGGFATLPGLVLTYYLTDSLGVAALRASRSASACPSRRPSRGTSKHGR